MNVLHHGPLGTRVMCDANWLEKFLSQLLVMGRFTNRPRRRHALPTLASFFLSFFLQVSDDGRVLLNDVDAIPQANRSAGLLVKCGHQQLKHHPYIAPEQEWPFKGKAFKDADMPGYDEKIDIWRVPETVAALLKIRPSASKPADPARARIVAWVAALSTRCRARRPADRPDIVELQREWRNLNRNI